MIASFEVTFLVPSAAANLRTNGLDDQVVGVPDMVATPPELERTKPVGRFEVVEMTALGSDVVTVALQ